MWNKNFKIILKLFQHFISHVTISETEIKLFQPLKEFWDYFENYFGDIEHVGKYSWAAMIIWNNFEIISAKFPCAEIKLFQTDVDKGRNNFEIIFISHVTTVSQFLVPFYHRHDYRCRPESSRPLHSVTDTNVKHPSLATPLNDRLQ